MKAYGGSCLPLTFRSWPPVKCLPLMSPALQYYLGLKINQDDDSIKFSVDVRITGMKGQKKTPGLFKEVPLTHLLPEIALEDSCRLLLYLAIVKGHLEMDAVDSLSSIQNLQTTKTRTRLQIQESSLDLPVFQQCTVFSDLTDKPMTYSSYYTGLNLVSKAAGVVDISVTR